jgi:hypothetical protein
MGIAATNADIEMIDARLAEMLAKEVKCQK